ncbi:MAG: beta-ketoacyl-[acyl-carrier-protein] synthase family protein [Chitinispirillia bacterium]|jgi:3-oxoacyl-[acyl-carrier-protein] synthase II
MERNYKQRVLITGLGIVCSCGNDIQSFSKALSDGKSNFSKISDPRLLNFSGKYAGFLKNSTFSHIKNLKEFFHLDPYLIFALEAAFQAVKDADIPLTELSEQLGLVFGTCSGPMQTIEKYYEQIQSDGKVKAGDNPFFRKYYSAIKILCHLLKIKGLSVTITTACSASTAAIGIASDLIRQGILKAVIVGGSDTFSPSTFVGFDGLKATCSSVCAPFSKPIGMNLGEGSGFLILENMQNALNRGAKIYGELIGFGMSNDAYHSSAPDPSGRGQALAMSRALRNSNLSPSDIRYVNAHGTGTFANDSSETKAMNRVFNEYISNIGISSTKSMVGHCLGAAGIIEVIASILCARDLFFPCTAGFKEPREGCTLDYIPDTGRKWYGRHIFMKNSFAFGGNNVSIIISSDFDKNSKIETYEEAEDEEICISGCGIISPAGPGIKSLTNAVQKNENYCNDVLVLNNQTYNAARIRESEIKEINRRLDLRNIDAASCFAVIAAKLAIQESRYPKRSKNLGNLGLYLTIASGSTFTESEYISALVKNNFQLKSIQNFPAIVPNSISGNVCRILGIRGHNCTFCGGHHSGVINLGLGVSAIRAGHTDSILCGASDELLPHSISPVKTNFHKNENRISPVGEGAALFLLEKKSTLTARNVNPVATICGMCFSSDCENRQSCDGIRTNLKKTINNAIEITKISKDEIHSVCCDTQNTSVMKTLEDLFYSQHIQYIDVSYSIGFLESSGALMSIAYSLYYSRLGNRENKNYILSVFSSHEGNNSVLVLKQ